MLLAQNKGKPPMTMQVINIYIINMGRRSPRMQGCMPWCWRCHLQCRLPRSLPVTQTAPSTTIPASVCEA